MTRHLRHFPRTTADPVPNRDCPAAPPGGSSVSSADAVENGADPGNIARLLPLFVVTGTVAIRGTWIVPSAAWLTVFCLLGLGPFISAKVITGMSVPTVAADVVDAAPPPAKAYVRQDSLGQADRLLAFQPTEIKQVPTLSLAAIAPAESVQAPLRDDPPGIVGRHRHETNSLPATDRKPTARPGSGIRDTMAASGVKAQPHSAGK